MMLNKKPDEVPKPNAVRFIAIASILIKSIEAIILNRIKHPLNAIISNSQVDFIKEGECGIHTTQLANQVMDLLQDRHNNLKYYGVFIDFKSALNKVNHNKLFEKLERANIDNDTINMIKLVFSNIKL